MYQAFKRRGNHVELLPESPIFKTLEDAITWASEFFKANASRFQHGLEAIEVKRVPRDALTGSRLSIVQRDRDSDHLSNSVSDPQRSRLNCRVY
jgi:hypothetical protein